jgi:prepilin-type N-terminal cleavage/methylation domain-containing protein/prepilin-type processing-associated H-X9-DG protein
MKAKNGFTLIEILIVVAIIILLAALLFPAFSRARENARRAGCMSNLKQIGLGIAQYTQDYDERLPQPWTYVRFDGTKWVKNPSTASDGKYGSWRVFIKPYVKSTAIFQCPSNPKRNASAGDGEFHISYGCNYSNWNYVRGSGQSDGPMFMDYSGSIGVTKPPQHLAQINNPSQVWIVTEMTSDGPFAPYDQKADELDEFATELFAGHFGRANWLFLDGHVKALKPSQTAIPLNMWIPNATGQAPSNGSYYIRDKLLYADTYWQNHS